MDLSQVTPSAYACDAVVEIREPDSRVAACVVVEVQLERDPDKPLTWPEYLTSARRRRACPATLLVVAPDPDVARWAGQPIEIGHPRFTLEPVVIGPERVPLVDDPEGALPELAVLSVLAHPDEEAVARAAVEATRPLAEDRQRLYLDVVWAAVVPAVRAALEAWMQKYEYQSDFARKYLAEGKAEGRAEGRLDATRDALLRVLERRGFDLRDEHRRRIATEEDLVRLERWLDAAITAATVAEVFADS